MSVTLRPGRGTLAPPRHPVMHAAADRAATTTMSALQSQVYAIASVSCGRDHTLALLATGKAFGWGGDGSGRIPSGAPEYCSTRAARPDAVEVNMTEPLLAVAAGHGVSLAITAKRDVAVWGANAAGIAGRREAISPANPQPIAELRDVQAIAAGEFLFGAIDARGGLHTWGLNLEGALGRATPRVNAAPGRVV